jgi:hypothetical protein
MLVSFQGARAGELILLNSPQERCKDREAFKQDVQILVDRATSETLSLANVNLLLFLSLNIF